MGDKVILPHGLVVIVGEACNLKCKNCGNLVPHAIKERMHYNIEKICNSLEILFQVVEPFECLQIQGGNLFYTMN